MITKSTVTAAPTAARDPRDRPFSGGSLREVRLTRSASRIVAVVAPEPVQDSPLLEQPVEQPPAAHSSPRPQPRRAARPIAKPAGYRKPESPDGPAEEARREWVLPIGAGIVVFLAGFIWTHVGSSVTSASSLGAL